MRDDPTATVESLKRQISPPTKIIVACGSKELAEKITLRKDDMVAASFLKPEPQKSLGERIASALNRALQAVNLNEFDYLLRVDADIILPKEFIALNLPRNHSVFHGDGSTFFFSMVSFKDVLEGKFPVVNREDSYVILKYQKKGYTMRDWAVKPIILRTDSRHNSWKYYYNEGYWGYKLGFEILHHSFGSLRHALIERNMFEFFGIAGFVVAWATRTEKLDVADHAWRTRAPFSFKKLKRLLRSRGI